MSEILMPSYRFFQVGKYNSRPTLTPKIGYTGSVTKAVFKAISLQLLVQAFI